MKFIEITRKDVETKSTEEIIQDVKNKLKETENDSL